MIERFLKAETLGEDNTFLFGARQTGKTTLLLQLFPNARFYDLLESNTYERLQRNPSLLRQDLEMCESGTLVIIDEVQSLPILLNEVSYRLENGNTYSFSSQYVAEKVAEKLNINASDITMNDAKLYFTMDALKSKVVPVVLQSDVTTARQYDIYGIPMLDPSSVTIYGPQEVIDTVKTVRTELLTMNNVSQNFDATLSLDLLGGIIHSDVEEVKAEVQVEKFTEMDVEVPIKMTDSLKMRFFPETMSVKCLVAMRDYASITPESFSVAFDKQQLKARQPLLDVRLASWPPTVQILSTRPDKVEYLIVQ